MLSSFRRSSLPCLEKCRYLLHVAARAWPGAADCPKWLEMGARARPEGADGSKWPLELAPEPQNTRKVPLQSAPEPQNARRVPLESASEPQNARRVPLEPLRRRRMLDGCRSSLPWSRSMFEKTALTHDHGCAHFLRSKWPLENAASCSSVLGFNFCSAPPCFVHVMHGFTVVYIYRFTSARPAYPRTKQS